MDGRPTRRRARLRTSPGGVAHGVAVAIVASASATVAVMLACGVGIRRDYSTIPAGQVGFDDLCGLQDYFDTIEARLASPPTLASAVDLESTADQRIQGGKNRFTFETAFQLQNLRRVLDQNWNRLPPAVAKAEQVDIEVHWSEKAGVRRVVTDGDAALLIGREEFPLPYHVCLSELLYGEPLYRQRREISGRALPYRSLLGNAGIPPAPPTEGGAGASASGSGAATATPGPDAGPTRHLAPAPAATPATPATPAPAAPASPLPPPTPTPVHDGAAPAPAQPIFKAAPPAH